MGEVDGRDKWCCSSTSMRIDNVVLSPWKLGFTAVRG
jgi:hypothetical protein